MSHTHTHIYRAYQMRGLLNVRDERIKCQPLNYIIWLWFNLIFSDSLDLNQIPPFIPFHFVLAINVEPFILPAMFGLVVCDGMEWNGMKW
jgi:hypothetical protein